MSTTITIPRDKGNPVVVVLNGKKYTYAAGETVSVPDDVAALLAANNQEAVIYGRRATSPIEAAQRTGNSGGVPAMVDDQGTIYVPESSTTDGIYVEGHKLIIPSTEE